MSMPMMMAYNVGSYSGAANYQVSTTSVNNMSFSFVGMNLTELSSEIIDIGKRFFVSRDHLIFSRCV